MATLTFRERQLIERLLDMGNGFVLKFSDRTFSEFFKLDIGVDIYSGEFAGLGESKAKRLRCFLEKAEDQLVMQALSGLIQHGREEKCLGGTGADFVGGLALVRRLKSAASAPDVTALVEAADGVNDALLLRQIQESLRQDEPQAVVDRLHTFSVRFVRRLCAGRGIEVANPNGESKPLNSIFGEYVRSLRDAGQIESAMGDKILRNAISVLGDFNTVRNTQSLAHDNPVLGRAEATLIVGNISSLIRFVQTIEAQINSRTDVEAPLSSMQADDLDFPPEEDLPF